MDWHNRDLQKEILLYLAQTPEISEGTERITLHFFKTTEDAYILKDKFHHLAQQLHLETNYHKDSPSQLGGATVLKSPFVRTADILSELSGSKQINEWKDAIVRNCYYLNGHHFLERENDSWRITAQGIDFLADDGGLSAILGVVTVKLHSDTIKDLLSAKIDQANIPETEKSFLKTELGKMKDTALSTLTENAINAIPFMEVVRHLKVLLSA